MRSCHVDVCLSCHVTDDHVMTFLFQSHVRRQQKVKVAPCSGQLVGACTERVAQALPQQ